MAADPSFRGLFWNDRERRPRAPWRVGLAVVALLVALLGATLVASGLAALAPSTAPPTVTAVVTTAAGLVQYGGLAAGVLAAAWLVDRRRLADLGLGVSRAWWADAAFGLVLGLALPGVVFALELAAGFVRVTGTLVARADPTLAIGPGVAPPLALALTLAYFVGVGVFEELLFRGYLLTNVAEGLDGWRGIGRSGALAAAVAVSSLAFAVGHAANPNATPLAALTIALFGALFGASYLLTERIAVAVGAHVAWNFAISSVFGFPVSGFTTPVTILAVAQSGPPLLTGGAFGPEGGLLSLVALGVGTGALLGWVRWREGELRVHPDVAVPALRSRDREEIRDREETRDPDERGPVN